MVAHPQASTALYTLKFKDKILVKTQSSDALLKKMKVRVNRRAFATQDVMVLLN